MQLLLSFFFCPICTCSANGKEHTRSEANLTLKDENFYYFASIENARILTMVVIFQLRFSRRIFLLLLIILFLTINYSALVSDVYDFCAWRPIDRVVFGITFFITSIRCLEDGGDAINLRPPTLRPHTTHNSCTITSDNTQELNIWHFTIQSRSEKLISVCDKSGYLCTPHHKNQTNCVAINSNPECTVFSRAFTSSSTTMTTIATTTK